MTTRISNIGPEPLMRAQTAASRVTPQPAEPFRAVMRAGAHAVMNGAEQAIQRLPGGAVLAAAFHAEPIAVQRQAQTTASPEPDPAVPGVAGGSGATGENAQIESVMAESANQNLYFLGLQQQISAENRQYTALSNVLKARHDTVKNAIGNVR